MCTDFQIQTFCKCHIVLHEMRQIFFNFAETMRYQFSLPPPPPLFFFFLLPNELKIEAALFSYTFALIQKKKQNKKRKKQQQKTTMQTTNLKLTDHSINVVYVCVCFFFLSLKSFKTKTNRRKQ